MDSEQRGEVLKRVEGKEKRSTTLSSWVLPQCVVSLCRLFLVSGLSLLVSSSDQQHEALPDPSRTQNRIAFSFQQQGEKERAQRDRKDNTPAIIDASSSSSSIFPLFPLFTW